MKPTTHIAAPSNVLHAKTLLTKPN